MKCLYKFIRECIDVRDGLAVICYSVFAWYWIDGTKGIIIEILGGIPIENGNMIEIVPLGKWLFLFAFYFLIVCRKLSKSRSILNFTLYRHKYFKLWWKYHFITIHITNFLIFIISCAIWRILEIFDGKSSDGNFAVTIVFFLHLSVWISILTLSDIIFERKIAPCILLILEGMLYIFSVNYNMPYLVCGMYVRCSYSELGVVAAAAYGIEIFIIAVCYFTAPQLWKFGYLERKIIGWKV